MALLCVHRQERYKSGVSAESFYRLIPGQLDGTSPAFEASDWSSPNFLVAEPTIIPLPFQVERIAFGAKHLLLLDRDNLVWEMRSFGSVCTVMTESHG